MNFSKGLMIIALCAISSFTAITPSSYYERAKAKAQGMYDQGKNMYGQAQGMYDKYGTPAKEMYDKYSPQAKEMYDTYSPQAKEMYDKYRTQGN